MKMLKIYFGFADILHCHQLQPQKVPQKHHYHELDRHLVFHPLLKRPANTRCQIKVAMHQKLPTKYKHFGRI